MISFTDIANARFKSFWTSSMVTGQWSHLAWRCRILWTLSSSITALISFGMSTWTVFFTLLDLRHQFDILSPIWYSVTNFQFDILSFIVLPGLRPWSRRIRRRWPWWRCAGSWSSDRTAQRILHKKVWRCHTSNDPFIAKICRRQT